MERNVNRIRIRFIKGDLSYKLYKRNSNLEGTIFKRFFMFSIKDFTLPLIKLRSSIKPSAV